MMNLSTLIFKDLLKLQRNLFVEYFNRFGRFKEALYNKYFSSFLFKYKKPFYRIIKGGDTFILDIRDLRSMLGDFTQIIQFLVSMKSNYNHFEVWISDKTIESRFPGKEFSKEALDVFNLIRSSLNIELIVKEKKCKINSKHSFISLSPDVILNTKIFSTNCQKYFYDEFNLESMPIKYNFDIDYKNKPELQTLANSLKNTFNIIISPTIDLNLKVERFERRYGVISEETFLSIENLYLELQEKIKEEGITDIRFIYLNKKMYNMKYFPNIIDLRHFEDFGLNFGSIFYFMQDNANWTIGSEGTLQQYLLISSELKHALYIDNHYWGVSHGEFGLSAPFFMANCKYLDYDDAPSRYIPIKSQVIESIFEDYHKFKKLKNNNLQTLK